MIVIWLLLGINAVLCDDPSEPTGNESKVVTLEDFTKEKGYEPKNSGWTKLTTKNELSINVAEFNKASNNECVRVVHFSVVQEPLDAVEVPCDDSPLHTGLVLHEGAYLTYYTVAYVERVPRPTDSTFSVRTRDDSTCNFVSIIRENAQINTRKMMIIQKGQRPACNLLIDENVEMSLLSYKDVRSIDISKLEPIVSYNYGKKLGARIYQIKNGLVCYRQLRFYSFDLDLDLALTMTCGSVREVSMTEQAFKSKYIMIQPHDSEKDTFTFFINPSGLFEQSKEGEESQKCKTKKFTLTKDGDRYVKKMIDTEFVQQSPECSKFVDGNFLGKGAKDGEVIVGTIVPLITDKELFVDNLLNELGEYTLAQSNDYNLANELGIVVIKFKKPGTPGFKTVIYVVVRSTVKGVVKRVVLTWYFLEDNQDRVALDISDDTLYCNAELAIKKSELNTFAVIVPKNDNECEKKLYEVTDSGERERVEDWFTVSKTDSDCEELLKRKQGNIQQSQTT